MRSTHLGGASVNGVVLVHVLHVVHRNEGVVDGHDLDVGAVRGSAHDEAERSGAGIVRRGRVLDERYTIDSALALATKHTLHTGSAGDNRYADFCRGFMA